MQSLEKEINENLFAKADLLVDKISFCQRIKVSNSQTSLDRVESAILLTNFATQMFQAFTLLYLTLLVNLGF